MSTLLRYDATNMFRLPITVRDRQHLDDAKKAVIEAWKNGQQGWLGCPDDTACVNRIKKLVKEKSGFTTCLVLGIGGSDLGARAVWHAMKDEAKGMTLEFAGGNTDPDELASIVKRLNLKKTLINVISKSGNTVETMSAFLIVREALIAAVGETKARQQIVATTDEDGGILHEISMKEGYARLPVPKNIGGRFSVLTDVGLFPIACAGINIAAMLRGAKDLRDEWLAESSTQNEAGRFAALHVYGDRALHMPIHVLMPYSERLRMFAFWYRQIWAESLGKDGHGPTPIAALGATDQHSQLQLYQEGPKDKIISFIEIEGFKAKLKVPNAAKKIPQLAYLAGLPLEKIIHAERDATAHALAHAGRVNGTLHISRVDETTLGALFMFYEIATAMAGQLYGVNAYDQPGVEASKTVMRTLLEGNVLS
jgi:glucose-6-phosphate isomerase